MSLTTLPPELQATIIEMLDTKSLHSLYEAGILCLQGLVLEFQFSANTFATANSLKTNFFSAISKNVLKLNLCGATGLTLPLLSEAITNMNNLQDLNVMYTNITMADFLQIVKVRPTLKTIAISFVFPGGMSQINDEVLLDYQKAFEGFKSVHFIGSLHCGLHGALALRMLEKANLRRLQFTCTWLPNSSPSYAGLLSNLKIAKVTQFQVYFIEPLYMNATRDLRVLTAVNFNKYEILIIKQNPFSEPIRYYTVFATTFLKNVITENFVVEVECLAEWPKVSVHEIQKRINPFLQSETAFMFWHKKRNTFDEKFIKKILMIFRNHYVFSLKSDNLKPVPAEFKWYSVEPTAPIARTLFRNSFVELNYEFAFKDKEDVKLNVMFNDNHKHAVPKIINNHSFLKKITHLSFNGSDINYDSSFFNIIFEYCHSLVTLKVVNKAYDSRFNAKCMRFLTKSKSLKNISIMASDLKFSTLFIYLSQCRSLENICLYEYGPNFLENLPDPTDLFTKCGSLYNILIMGQVTDVTRKKLKELYYKFRSDLGKDALNIEIDYIRYGFIHPYTSVFSTYQLKPM